LNQLIQQEIASVTLQLIDVKSKGRIDNMATKKAAKKPAKKAAKKTAKKKK